MPLNLLKKYNQLLELAHLTEAARTQSLHGVFSRDVIENQMFWFNSKQINPTKGNEPPMQILFKHLTTVIVDKETRKREYEPRRSKRLHWLKHHIDEKKAQGMLVFSCEDPEGIRTYIYDSEEFYVIILEPYRDGSEYYLLTAYYLEGRNKDKIKKKYKRRLPDLY